MDHPADRLARAQPRRLGWRAASCEGAWAALPYTKSAMTVLRKRFAIGGVDGLSQGVGGVVGAGEELAGLKQLAHESDSAAFR